MRFSLNQSTVCRLMAAIAISGIIFSAALNARRLLLAAARYEERVAGHRRDAVTSAAQAAEAERSRAMLIEMVGLWRGANATGTEVAMPKRSAALFEVSRLDQKESAARLACIRSGADPEGPPGRSARTWINAGAGFFEHAELWSNDAREIVSEPSRRRQEEIWIERANWWEDRAGAFRNRLTHDLRMLRKYQSAARRPWLPVEMDEPTPR